MTTAFHGECIPFVSSAADACHDHEDCALVKEHPGACYLIAYLYRKELRAQLRAARVKVAP